MTNADASDGKARRPSWGLGVALGLGIGVAMWAATGDPVVGIAVGVALAVVFAVAAGGARKRPRGDTGGDGRAGPGDG